MRTIRLGLVGVGNVGRRLLELLGERKTALARDYGLEFTLNFVADSSGIATCDEGFDVSALAMSKMQGTKVAALPGYEMNRSFADAMDDTRCDILLEASPLNLQTGEPGLTNSRLALLRGVHLVLANKSPLALAHGELADLAETSGAGLLYSATFCGGLPVLNVLRRDMVCGEILRFRGIFNGTTNFILQELLNGHDYSSALQQAQAIGAAEADPALDVGGWDTAAKLVIAANNFCERKISLDDVQVTGIEHIEPSRLLRCSQDGTVLKLVGSAERVDDRWSFTVEPVAVPLDSFLGGCTGWEMAVEIDSDIYGKSFYKLWEREPLPTAASMLRDAVHLATGGRQASL